MFIIEIIFYILLFILIIKFIQTINLSGGYDNNFKLYKEKIKRDKEVVLMNNKKIDKLEKEIKLLKKKL